MNAINVTVLGLNNNPSTAPASSFDLNLVVDNQGAVSVSGDAVQAPAPLRVEAETLQLTNYNTEELAFASGGTVIRVPSGEGRASYSFGGPAGTYDLDVSFIDELDGSGRISVFIDGQEAEFIALDAYDSSQSDTIPTQADQLTRTISGVQLETGSIIEFVGVANQGEHARLDYLELRPVAVSSPSLAELSVSIDVSELVGEFESTISVSNATIASLTEQLAAAETRISELSLDGAPPDVTVLANELTALVSSSLTQIRNVTTSTVNGVGGANDRAILALGDQLDELQRDFDLMQERLNITLNLFASRPTFVFDLMPNAGADPSQFFQQQAFAASSRISTLVSTGLVPGSEARLQSLFA